MVLICRPYITLKNGRVITAESIGKKAICFEVSEEDNKKYQGQKKTKKKD